MLIYKYIVHSYYFIYTTVKNPLIYVEINIKLKKFMILNVLTN